MPGAVRPQVAVDFDGVLNDHATGFTVPAVVTDPPTPGALDWLSKLVEDLQVVVFSARAEDSEGIQAIVDWMNDNGFGQLPYTIASVKPPFALWYIDDRGWQFDGHTYPSAAELIAARPWWQTQPNDAELPPISGTSAEALAASLVARAAQEAPEVQDTLERAVRAAGGALVGLDDRFKGASAIEGKLKVKMAETGMSLAEAADDLRDALRFTAVYDTADYTAAVARTLDLLVRGAGLTVERYRNYWVDGEDPRGLDGTYVGINVNLLGLDGYLFELQFHTPQSLDVQALNWGFYRLIRSEKADPADLDVMLAQMRQNNQLVPTPPGIDGTLTAGTIPASAHYRRASSGGHSCGNCSYYSTGTVGMCGMFDTLVKPSYVCDKWAKGQDAMPGQEKWHPERGGIQASAADDALMLLMEQIAYVAAVHQPYGGYGDTWWNPETSTVYWVCADWTSNDEVASAIRQFHELRGIVAVDACAECPGPQGDGWRKVYPNSLTAALPRRTSPPPVPVGRHNEILQQAHKRAAELEPKLVAVIEPILKAAAQQAARKFLATVTSHLTAAADITPASTMVALYPRPDEQQALADAHPGGEEPGGIHVTLAYMGELGPDDTDKIIRTLAPVAGTHPPLQGHVGGVGAFDDDNGVPAIALPDVRGLTELRQAVAQAITDTPGIDYQRSHGFTPHLTVAYRSGRSHPASRKILGQPLHFDALHVVRGDRILASHPLTGSPALTAAGDAPPPDWTAPAGDELVDVPALVAQITAKTAPVRKAFVEAAMTPALQEAGLSFDASNPLAAKALASSGRHITSIAETTRENVRKSIAAAYQTGLSIPDTAKLISAAGTGMANTRATMIARTELTGAANAGSLAATSIIAGASGANYTKVWMTAPGAMYPRHEDYDGLDGQEVGLDEAFDVGGDQLQFPGDPDGDPGEVINCRCTMSYSTPEGEESADAEDTPDLMESGDDAASGVAESDVSGDVSDQTSEAEPMAIPANRFAAADQMTAGYAATATAKGLAPDAADLAQANTNWRRNLNGKIETDKATLTKVKDADSYNLDSAVHQAQIAKYGQDAALVVRPVKPDNPLYIKPGANAARMTGNRITLISSEKLDELTAAAPEMSRPGDAGASTRGGLAATLRHEYAHQIYDTLTPEQRSAFLDELPDQARIKDDLTLYSSTDPEEAFSELYAVVSDPAYNPNDWAPWIRQTGHDLFGAPLTEGAPAEAVPVARAVSAVTAPVGTSTLAADIERLKSGTQWITDKEALLQRGDQYTDPTGGLAQTGLIPASPLAQEQLGVTLQIGARVRQEMRIDTMLAQKVADAQAKVEQLAAQRTEEIRSHAQAYKDARAAYLSAENAEQDRLAMGRWGKAYNDLDYTQKADIQRILSSEPGVVSPELTRLKDAYYATIDAQNRLSDQLNPTPVRQAQLAAQKEAKALRSAQATNVRDEAMRVLGEIRPMGSTDETTVSWGKVGSKAGPGITKAKALIELAQENLPTEWIGSLKPIDAGTSSRGYEQDFGVGHKIRVSMRTSPIESDLDGQPVALHELGHAVEAQNPLVGQLEQAFYQWRTRGGSFTADQERAYKMSRFQPDSGYGAKEIAREDKFADPYFGKDYTRSGRTLNFELLTMGLESLFNGSYELDDEYLNWMLGVLATA